MIRIPNWRLLVYPANGTDNPSVIQRDQSYMLSAGIRMQITPEGDCTEASFNARGAGIQIPPLSTVSFQIENAGTWSNLFRGEVRQGGNARDLDGENYILRSLALRLKEVVLSPGFSTPKQPAYLTVRALVRDVVLSGQLGSPPVIAYDPLLIEDLSFDCRAITDGNMQTVAAFLDQIVQDGEGMNVRVRWGVNADGFFFCKKASEGKLSTPASNLLELKWKAPIAETPCTAVLWFVARRPDGTWVTHLSRSPSADQYGARVRAVSLDPGISPWIKATGGKIETFEADDNNLHTNIIPPDAPRKDITASAGYLTDREVGPIGDTFIALSGKSAALWFTPDAPVGRYVVAAGTTNSRTWATQDVSGQTNGKRWLSQMWTGMAEMTLYPPGGFESAPLRIQNADAGKDAAGNPAPVHIELHEVRPEVVDAATLDNLARYYYSTPAVAPAEIELRTFTDPDGIGEITIPDAPGGAYTAPVAAWEVRIGRERGMTLAALTGQAQKPENLAQAELIKLRDSRATMRALTAAR